MIDETFKDKLKPCPFCGSTDVKLEPLNPHRLSLFCGECHAGFHGADKEALIQKWTRRAGNQQDTILQDI